MGVNTVPYPAMGVPIVEGNGTPTAAFFNMLMQLWTRSGGAQGSLVGVQLTDGEVLPLDELAAEIVNEILTNPVTLAKLIAVIFPTGIPVPWPPGAPAPAGFVLCDGSAYSRTAEAALFAKIGTNFGAGDGFTTFNVPSMAQLIAWNPALTLLPILTAMPWIIKT